MPHTAGRTTSGIITVAKIRSAGSGRWLTENWPRGEGAFQVRKLSGERCVYYYRYTGQDGKQLRIALPRYDAQGAPISLAAARAEAKVLAHRYTRGEKDLKERIAYEQHKARQAREAEAAKELAEQARRSATLGKLLAAYCEHLAAQGKPSAGEARSSINRHIKEPFPALWETPAADIQPDQLTPILRRMVDLGLFSHTNKVRSYIRAAYAAACNAPLNAKAPETLRALHITANPARDLAVVQGARKTRDTVLSEDELRIFWRRLEREAGAGPAIVRFYLLTGGQRFEQLARATLEDIHDDCLTLWDPKGRRETPRRHVIPLLPAARTAMNAISPHRIGPYLISLNGGKSPCDNSAVTPHLKKVSRAMLKAGEVQHDFSFGVLRRTVETRLAAAGVSSDIRAQLQSHGLGGVQSRHYDRHSYLEEKRLALETLHDLVLPRETSEDELP
ncbi:MAG: hypothetical protein C0462_10310 [Alcanivorax sp.]|nr:hypothetical protein [Alcanivorax sp.]